MKLVRTPVPGVNDTVGQVTFVNGEAKVADDATELHYFRSAGYQIDDFDEALEAAKANEDDPAEAEDLEDLEAQPGDQDDDPLIVEDIDGDGVDEVLPRKSASTETWRQFAVEHGMSEDDANGKSRDELVAHFTAGDDDQEDPK
jgi:hypothetical protein